MNTENEKVVRDFDEWYANNCFPHPTQQEYEIARGAWYGAHESKSLIEQANAWLTVIGALHKKVPELYELDQTGIGCALKAIDKLAALQSQVSNTPQDGARTDFAILRMPRGLHPDTVELLERFMEALAEKLRNAEEKYGYSNGWKQNDWMDECRAKLLEHLAKGDPRDVANYCAFLWWHGAATTPPQQQEQSGEAVDAYNLHCKTCNGHGFVTYSVRHGESDFEDFEQECPVCDGAGKAPKHVQDLQARYQEVRSELHALNMKIGMVIKKAAEKCEEWAKAAEDFGFDGDAEQYRKMKSEILALTPANAEAELEALMMRVAEEVFNSAGSFLTEDEELRAIVRRVLDEKGE